MSARSRCLLLGAVLTVGCSKKVAPGTVGWASDLPPCEHKGQGDCCYTGKLDRYAPPQCTWKRLNPGDSTTITSASRRGGDWAQVTLPDSLKLSSVTPASFANQAECEKTPIGFILSGPGLKNGLAVSDIRFWTLKPDGTWSPGGSGGAIDLVATRNSDTTDHDRPAPSPTHILLGGNVCGDLARPARSQARAIIIGFSQLDFVLGGKPYRGDFTEYPNKVDGTTTYYAALRMGW